MKKETCKQATPAAQEREAVVDEAPAISIAYKQGPSLTSMKRRVAAQSLTKSSSSPSKLPRRSLEKVAAVGNPDQGVLRAHFEATLGVPFTDGNEVVRLVNGDEIFPAMLEAIDGAEKSINFLTYVYWDGDIATEFAEALSRRARSGVAMRVLLDAYGARPMPDSLRNLMEASGVQLRWFRPLSSMRLWRHDKRTHRKILVVDDTVAFTGGVGISRQWTGDAQDSNHWRETHFRIRGLAVRGFHAAFFDNWCEAGDWENPTFDDSDALGQQSESDAKGAAVQVLRSSATVGWTDVATMLRCAIDESRHTLSITTPYFAPDEKTENLLGEASERGVDVQILLPGPYTDQPLPQHAGGPSVERLLKRGVRFWEHQVTHVHAKLMVVDGVLSLIGSANFNHRSLGKDEECCAVVVNESVATQLSSDFHNDVSQSKEITLEAWQNRGLWKRTREKFSRLLLEQV